MSAKQLGFDVLLYIVVSMWCFQKVPISLRNKEKTEKKYIENICTIPLFYVYLEGDFPSK